MLRGQNELAVNQRCRAKLPAAGHSQRPDLGSSQRRQKRRRGAWRRRYGLLDVCCVVCFRCILSAFARASREERRASDDQRQQTGMRSRLFRYPRARTLSA